MAFRLKGVSPRDTGKDLTRDFHAGGRRGYPVIGPAYNVFTRRDGKIRDFCAAMSGAMADPGRRPAQRADLDPL
jgi:hypothetical protein